MSKIGKIYPKDGFKPNARDKYKCDDCNEHFRLWYSYLRHMKEVHKLDSTECKREVS